MCPRTWTGSSSRLWRRIAIFDVNLVRDGGFAHHKGAAQVQVQGNAPLVETRSSSIGQVFENELLVGLPLNVRSVTQLFTLAGAAVQTATLNIAGGLGFGTGHRPGGHGNPNPFTKQSLP